MAKHIGFLHGMDTGQVTKFKEPPISMCIYWGKSNDNKEDIDQHIICHSRGQKQLGCEHCEKAFTQ